MKYLAGLLILSLSAFSVAGAGDTDDKNERGSHRHYNCDDGISIDLDDATLVIASHDRRDECIEITEDFELYVDDRRVTLDDDQQKLVEEFYLRALEIRDNAHNIGWEGARIGVSGAKLGLKAVGRVFKMFLTSYDGDDLEEDMERDAGKLEARAEKLEKKAEKIEQMVDELDELAYEMRREIPELDELGWF